MIPIKKLIPAILTVLFLIIGTDLSLAQMTLIPINLRCEARANPLGIGNASPELSWQLESVGQGTAYRGLTQTAYEIIVGSSPGGIRFVGQRQGDERPELRRRLWRSTAHQRRTMLLAGESIRWR